MGKKRYFAALVVFAALAALMPLFLAPPAGADIFYASSNYANGSAGTIEQTGSTFKVNKDIVTNLGGDAWGFTFRDHAGAERTMIREYSYGPNDTVYVWAPPDWSQPRVNRKDWASNIHAVAAQGKYLYVATYESYATGSASQNTGEVVRIDMENNYAPDKRFNYPAFTTNGHTSSPHAEAIHIRGDRVYVLFAISYNGVDEYDPSEIVEFDLELNYKRTFKLEDTGNNGVAGKNPARMAYYNGKLYVACMGGFQGPNSWGDIWEVDLAAASPAAPKRVLDGHAIPHDLGGGTYAAVGMYGIQFASDGTAYILTGSYDSGYTFRARLFVTTAADLAAGNVTNNNNVVATYTTFDGHSWDILYDEEESMLWCMAGKTLQARSKDGKTLVKSFKPIDLGDDIYSISLLSDGSVLSSGGGGGGGGGGCDAGFTSAALLMLALGLMLRRRKGNRP